MGEADDVKGQEVDREGSGRGGGGLVRRRQYERVCVLKDGDKDWGGESSGQRGGSQLFPHILGGRFCSK